MALFDVKALNETDLSFMDFYPSRHWSFDELAIKLGGVAIDERVMAYNGLEGNHKGENSKKLSEIGIGWGPLIANNFEMNSSQVRQGKLAFIERNGIYQTSKMVLEKKLGITYSK